MTLLTETIHDLTLEGKTPSDVCWVGSPTVSFSWDEFAKLADISYDSGYGGQEIARDLLVVGSDWWLERGEYDGSEWWEFKQMPVRPPVGTVTTLMPGLWSALASDDNG